MIGVDLAKNVFQVHGASETGAVLFRKKLSRTQFQRFMAQQEPCVVAMEACGGANYWARELQRLGHSVKLISPRYVKPFIKRHKNDAVDAEARARSLPSQNRIILHYGRQPQKTLLLGWGWFPNNIRRAANGGSGACRRLGRATSGAC